ncbi:MAG: oligosaccharide flippase family protein [Anaerolineae bacterium]
MGDDVASQAVRGALFNTLGNYGIGIAAFLLGIAVYNLISPEANGLFATGMLIMMIFARVKLWGLNALLIAAEDPDDLEISTQFWLSVSLSTLVLLLIVIASPLLSLLYTTEQILMAVALAFIAIFEHEGAASTPQNILMRDMRYGVLAGLNFAAVTAMLVVQIGAALVNPTGWALLIGYAVKTVIVLIGVWWATPRRPKLLFSMERARRMMRQGAKLLWGGLGTFLAYRYDDIIVQAVSGQRALGLYDRAYSWSLMPMAIIGGILGVSAPTYAKARINRASLTEAVTAIFDVIALIALPASFGLVVVAPEFTAALFPDWTAATGMIQMLVLYSLFRPMNDSIGSLAPTLDRVEVQRLYGITQSVTMLVAATVLTLGFARLFASPTAGALGAALAAGLTVVVGFAVLYHGLLRDTVDVHYAQVFAVPLLASAVATAAAFGVHAAVAPLSPWVGLGIKFASFSLVYLLVLLAFNRARLIGRITQVIAILRPKEA